ncbi:MULTISPECIES: hypothetical protein [unclassified Streptomyces]|uniref:hypothetical protein n=1 Tax=unclassified Streptomyces TaxID=2593676 RepID=UPI00114CB0DF|nr:MULTISPECIES: hypothetical protein [unclassified Streptomyces]MYT17476.1 hypothetical protein [Streptomyces sp. SID4951]
MDEAGPRSELLFLIKPPFIAEGVETTLGVVCLVLAVVSGAVLVHASRRGTLERRWWPVLLPLVAAGLITGAAGRMVTMGTQVESGANIGAPLVGLAAGAAVLGLLVAALVAWLRSGRPSAERGGWPTATPQAR